MCQADVSVLSATPETEEKNLSMENVSDRNLSALT